MTSEYTFYLELIHVFTYSSFNTAFNGLKHIALNGRTIGERRNWKAVVN